MKIKQFVDLDKQKEITEAELGGLFEQYKMYSKLASDAKKQMTKLKAQIEELFKDKEADALGNFWVDTGNGLFKKEIRRKVTIDPMMADPILKRLNLFDKVVTYEPVYDLDLLNELIADGSLDEKLIEKMFKTEVSYAIKAQEKKKEQQGE